MTIPSDVLKSLGIDVGTELDVSVGNGMFTARPKAGIQRQRYSLRELLRGTTPATMRDLADDTAWAREGDSIGREV